MRIYEASKVANEILDLADKADDGVTPMQLIKLVYMCHGWTLGIYGRPLINDEVQAWKFGPVIPSLYHKVKEFRSKPVTGRLQLATDGFDGAKIDIDKKYKDLIAQVYEKYRDWSGLDLSWLTHKEGSPWSVVYSRNGNTNAVIGDDLIERHYSNLFQSSQNSSED